MCKILAIAGIKSSNVTKAWKFVAAVTPYLSANDKDGVGYAAQTRNGLFGERWISPKDAFKYRKPFLREDQNLLDTFRGSLTGTSRYNSFGTPVENKDEMHAIILHARMATCGVSLDNTHPFVRDNTALIHNGVIRNTPSLTNITSTCDSECILNEYITQDVPNNPEAIDLVTDPLVGYYACAVLTTDDKGKQYLDLFRDDQMATLYAIYVKELQTVVFCTKPEIIRAALKDLKWKSGSTLRVEPGRMLRVDAVTGEFLSMWEFTHHSSSWQHPAHYAATTRAIGSSASICSKNNQGE